MEEENGVDVLKSRPKSQNTATVVCEKFARQNGEKATTGLRVAKWNPVIIIVRICW